jgi:tetratricopeptide (TPR) repeat protein
MSDLITQLCQLTAEILQDNPHADVARLVGLVKQGIDANSRLGLAIQSDRQLIQIIQGNAKGFQTVVTGGTAYIGGTHLSDVKQEMLQEVLQKALGELLKSLQKQIPSDVRQGSPNFVGRVDDLRNLHESLQKEGIVAVCALRGMGGVGKTELAIQYALSKEFQHRYVACYWFSLNEGNLASLVLQKAAPYLAMPEEIQKSDDVYEQVKWCWQNWHPPEGEVLVILDDVKSLDDIPKQAMPINPRFKVMLTTRQRNLSPSFRELQLGVLPEHEALELLKRIVDRYGSSRIESELETAKEICRYLGYLPLALELAATYLVEDEMLTLGEYWQQLNLQDRSISDEMVKYITAERGVVSAFALSWLRLRDLSPQVAMLLGRFAPADIPWQDLVEPTVKSLGWDEAAVRKGRIQLANLHLISIREQKDIGIHSLLREYFRWQADNEGDNFIHFLQRAIVETGIGISKTMPQKPNKADIEKVRPTIPHLELISKDMLDNISNPEEDLFWAFGGVAKFYDGEGIYTSAVEFTLNCLQEAENRLGKEHPVVSSCLNNIALLYQSQGKYKEAESSMLRSLSIKETRLNQNTQLSYAIGLNNLALQKQEQGNYTEAESLILEAISILEQQPEIDYVVFAIFLNDLGYVYKVQGKYNKAESLYKNSLSIRELKLGKDHPDVAESLNNLAGLYVVLERFSEAESLYIRAILIREQQQGEEHPDYAISLHNLSLVYQYLGRLDEAESYCLQSISIREKKLGENHPYFASSLSNLAGIYTKRRKYDEAEKLCLKSLHIMEIQLGNEHPDIAFSLRDLAGVYKLQGKYDEAEQTYLKSLRIMETQLGVDHPEIPVILIGLSSIYRTQGKLKQSERLLKRALSIVELLKGSNHPDAKRISEIIYDLQNPRERTIKANWWQSIIIVLFLPLILIINGIDCLIRRFGNRDKS